MPRMASTTSRARSSTRSGDCSSNKAFAFRTPSAIFMYARMRRPHLPRLPIGDIADREALGGDPFRPLEAGPILTHQALRARSPHSPAVRERSSELNASPPLSRTAGGGGERSEPGEDVSAIR